MATWKKVIVSGSNAELNHITASGTISASGKLYGNLDLTSEQTYVVIYNTVTGELEYKELNLVNAQRAPEVYLADIDKTSTDRFRLSLYSGSGTVPSGWYAPYKPSASLEGSSGPWNIDGSNTYDLSINNLWDDVQIGNVAYYDPYGPTNETASISEGNADGPEDARNGLITGTSKTAITLHLNSTYTTSHIDSTATPAYTPGPAYQNAAFDCPPGTSEDTASIQVFVNQNDSPTAEFFLTASTGNPAITTTLSNITADISPSGSSKDLLSTIDTTKSWRSGSVDILTGAQRDGYNYAYVIYTGSRDNGATQITALTNFVEWFYDNDGAGEAMNNTAIPDSDVSLTGLTADETSSVSGIHYYNGNAADSATLLYKISQSNQYRNIYPSTNGLKFYYDSQGIDNVTITQGSATTTHLDTNPTTNALGNVSSPQSIALAPLSTTQDNGHLVNTEVTASFGINFDEIPTNTNTNTSGVHHPSTFLGTTGTRPWGDLSNNLDFTFNVDFEHPNKTNKNRAANAIDSFLVRDWDANTNSNVANYEDFKTEEYRIQSAAYANYTNPSTSNDEWDGEKNIVDGGDGFNKGLLQYHSYLCYPKFAGLNSDPGNFTTDEGPVQLHDYSTGGGSEATGEREYFRYFQVNSAANGAVQLNIEFVGSGSICRDGNTTQFQSGKSGFKVYVNRTGGGASSAYTGEFTNGANIKVGTTLGDQESIPLARYTTGVNYSDSAAFATGGSTGVPIGVLKIKDDSADAYAAGDYIIVRIVTPQNWTGYINAMALTFGNTQQNGRIIGLTETLY